MKKLHLLILFILIGIIGCTESTDKLLKESIELYVCTTDGVTSDLNFKMISLEEIAPITATDSMLYYYAGTLPASYYWDGDSIHFKVFDFDLYEWNDVMTISKIDEYIWKVDSSLNEGEEVLTELKTMHEKMQNNYSISSSEMVKINSIIEDQEQIIDEGKESLNHLNLAKEYSKLPKDTVLGRRYNCTYSILNPVLKLKQTQTKTFYFNDELTQVLGASDVIK